MAYQRILNGHEFAFPAGAAINPKQPVELAGTDFPFLLPIGTNSVRPWGVNGHATAGASGLASREHVTVYEPGNIVKVVAAASVGVAAEVSVASSNGAVSGAALSAASGHWALGIALSTAAAGEILSVFIQPRKV